MAAPVTAVLLGAGSRGNFSYAPYALAHPDELRFVAVAEPDPGRRARFAEAHGIPPERQFAAWQDLMNEGKLADACFNTTMDQTHHRSTLAALEAGYEVLLEKPMAPTLEENVALVQAAERHDRLLQVCHVLRYSPFFRTLNRIVTSGRLGEIMTVEQRENVAYWHMAHSYVRGNWRNHATSSPMLLAKCCHDLDLLYWNLGRPATRVQSFGSLIHFRPENAPAGATERCTDGCPAAEQCPYDARRIYLDPDHEAARTPVFREYPDVASRRRALETGPYGRCVYRCDNDVVDHQTVNLEFEGGTSVVLVMHGHSHEEARTMRYDGTRATLRGKFTYAGGSIEIHDHVTDQHEVVEIPSGEGGHGGGDFGMVRGFVRAMRGEEAPLTCARESLESHLMAFAAETSRATGTVVEMEAFRHRAERRAAPDEDING